VRTQFIRDKVIRCRSTCCVELNARLYNDSSNS